jgi:hypothetical protein
VRVERLFWTWFEGGDLDPDLRAICEGENGGELVPGLTGGK